MESSLGAMLRDARLAQGRDLAHVADQIKVNPRYLEALEADDLKSLPGGFFYKSFVRQYASALGIDPRRVEEALSQTPLAEAPLPLPVPAEQPILKDLKPMPAPAADDPGLLITNRMLPSVGVLLLVMIACGGFYAWWHRIQTAPVKENGVRRVSRVLPPDAEPTPAPTPTATATPIPEEPTPTPASRAAASAGSGVKLVLTATEPSWVRVSCDGRNVFTGVLKPGDSKVFEASENARLRTGNSGGLAIVWNGKPLEFPGPRVFVRDLSFTHDAWQPTPGAVVPTPPPVQPATQAPTG